METDGSSGPTEGTALSISQNYSCNSCQISFGDSREQRAHMKEPWHVTNVKRRVALLPPITRDSAAIATQHETSIGHQITRKRSSDSLEEETESAAKPSQEPLPFQCLFCNQAFAEEDDGFASNLEHMHEGHGMSIPEPDAVADLQSFLGYLAVQVRQWHECLYCGTIRSSTQSIQAHMRDKGHCLLNLDREPELLDFWDGPQRSVDGEANEAASEDISWTAFSANERLLASGKIVNSRYAACASKRAQRKRILAISTSATLPQDLRNEETSIVQDMPTIVARRHVIRLEEKSISGLSAQSRQALVLAEKKAQRNETLARRAREWAYARGANSQKYDQIDTTGKFGKQNHKLLPR